MGLQRAGHHLATNSSETETAVAPRSGRARGLCSPHTILRFASIRKCERLASPRRSFPSGPSWREGERTDKETVQEQPGAAWGVGFRSRACSPGLWAPEAPGGTPRPQDRAPFTCSHSRTEACVPGSVPSPSSSLLFQPQQEEAGTRSARPVPLALPAQAP